MEHNVPKNNIRSRIKIDQVQANNVVTGSAPRPAKSSNPTTLF